MHTHGRSDAPTLRERLTAASQAISNATSRAINHILLSPVDENNIPELRWGTLPRGAMKRRGYYCRETDDEDDGGGYDEVEGADYPSKKSVVLGASNRGRPAERYIGQGASTTIITGPKLKPPLGSSSSSPSSSCMKRKSVSFLGDTGRRGVLTPMIDNAQKPGDYDDVEYGRSARSSRIPRSRHLSLAPIEDDIFKARDGRGRRRRSKERRVPLWKPEKNKTAEKEEEEGRGILVGGGGKKRKRDTTSRSTTSKVDKRLRLSLASSGIQNPHQPATPYFTSSSVLPTSQPAKPIPPLTRLPTEIWRRVCPYLSWSDHCNLTLVHPYVSTRATTILHERLFARSGSAAELRQAALVAWSKHSPRLLRSLVNVMSTEYGDAELRGALVAAFRAFTERGPAAAAAAATTHAASLDGFRIILAVAGNLFLDPRFTECYSAVARTRSARAVEIMRVLLAYQERYLKEQEEKVTLRIRIVRNMLLKDAAEMGSVEMLKAMVEIVAGSQMIDTDRLRTVCAESKVDAKEKLKVLAEVWFNQLKAE